jgi:hypothetical protein
MEFNAKIDLKEWYVTLWPGLNWHRIGPVADCFELGSEPSGLKKGRIFFTN